MTRRPAQFKARGASRSRSRPKASMKRKRILFVTYGGGHVTMVIPIVERLRARGGIDVQVLGLTTATAALKRHNIPHFGFRELLRETDQRAAEIGRQLAADTQHPDVDPAESVAYLGLSYAELEEDYGTAAARERYEEMGRFAFIPRRTLRRCLEERRPDLVVATNTPRAERAAILAAEELGIPAVCIGDLFLRGEIEWLRAPGYADKVCVLCDHVRDHLVSEGRRPEEIEVTGNPAFDYLADPAHKESGLRLRRERGWDCRKVILWLPSQREPAYDPQSRKRGDVRLLDNILDRLFAACGQHKDWQLVIRPHPNAPPIRRSLPVNTCIIGQETGLGVMLGAIDIAMHVWSTSGLEAAITGKPVVRFEKSVLSWRIPEYAHALFCGAKSLDDIEEALIRAQPASSKALSHYPPAGDAALRVEEVILGLL